MVTTQTAGYPKTESDRKPPTADQMLIEHLAGDEAELRQELAETRAALSTYRLILSRALGQLHTLSEQVRRLKHSNRRMWEALSSTPSQRGRAV